MVLQMLLRGDLMQNTEKKYKKSHLFTLKNTYGIATPSFSNANVIRWGFF